MSEPTRSGAIYEGKAKILYEIDGDPEHLILFFKDDATAFNAKKRGSWERKGVVNSKISAALTALVQKAGVPTHFVRNLSDREQLVKRVEIVPVEVVVRNRVAGSLARRLGMEEGGELSQPFVEWYYKSDSLDDPMLLTQWILEFGFATQSELDVMREYALTINRVVGEFFDSLGITLIDFKVEFGRIGDSIVLADEITPDGSRLWEKGTNRKLDKDRFRRDLGDVAETYEELLQRVEAALEQS
jgi:phosphoribosylaminoimidazole-succinocarboxamide synthase